MTDTPEHDPAETPVRPGLAGGAARALRAARQSASAGSAAVETPAAESDAVAVADPVDETRADTPTDTPADDTSDTDGGDAERLTETPIAETPIAETPIDADPDETNETDQTDAQETTADPSDDSADDPTDDPTDDPDAPPVLAPVRAPKRKAATSKAAGPDPAETEPAGPDLVTSTRKDTTRTRLLAISATLTAAALVFALVASVLWWRAGHDDDRDAAAARDDVAVDARLAIATVNTSDYRKPANALTNWIGVATGSLEKQFTTSRASATTLLAQAKKVTTATVLDVAVTKLDGRSASVIASVNVKQQPVSGAASTVRNRFRASMTKVGDEWKLADLAQVDVQLS